MRRALVELYVNIAYNVSKAVVSISQRMKFNERNEPLACPFKALENCWCQKQLLNFYFIFETIIFFL